MDNIDFWRNNYLYEYNESKGSYDFTYEDRFIIKSSYEDFVSKYLHQETDVFSKKAEKIKLNIQNISFEEITRERVTGNLNSYKCEFILISNKNNTFSIELEAWIDNSKNQLFFSFYSFNDDDYFNSVDNESFFKLKKFFLFFVDEVSKRKELRLLLSVGNLKIAYNNPMKEVLFNKNKQ